MAKFAFFARIVATLIVASLLSGGIFSFYISLLSMAYDATQNGFHNQNILQDLVALGRSFVGGTFLSIVFCPISIFYSLILIISQFIVRRSRLSLVIAGAFGSLFISILGKLLKKSTIGSMPISASQLYLGLFFLGGLVAVSLPWSRFWIWIYPSGIAALSNTGKQTSGNNLSV